METLLKSQTILIVDDAVTNINILAELLKPQYKIRVAIRGEKALEIAFSDDPPDLILLDVLMPGMDGYEVCAKLKAFPQTKGIPVIFITGKNSEEDEIKGFNIGAVEFITKPFSSVVVKARVNTHAELKRYRDYLERISFLDGLTGIPNRRKFDEYLDYAYGFAIRESFPVSMVMMDVDHFKLYNDHYGHQEGDACLIKVARAFSGAFARKTDFVARYGGEEFACILPNTPLEATLALAEKLRIQVASLQIPHSASPTEPFVTISLGVASILPSAASSCKDLISAADEALYLSKKSGRNKVSS
jgi:diguanylate cyclase (GGDEF)-like protein